MHTRFAIVILLFIINKTSQSQCICNKDEERVYCTKQTNNQHLEASLIIDPSSPNQLPFNDINNLEIHCNIKTAQPMWFTNQGSLRNLNLAYNTILRIAKAHFDFLPNLQTLNLSHNMLPNLTRYTFDSLTSLKVLDLSFNRISNIERSLFNELTKLEKLYLNNNGIFEIENSIFSELSDLLVVDLSYNHLRVTSVNVFTTNEKLQRLNLAENNVGYKLPQDFLNDLKKIMYLNLSNCNITLPPNAFKRTTKLIVLDLSKNNLLRLPSDAFNELKDLKTLNLANCQLFSLPTSLFNQNSKLEDINLSHNNFRTLPDGIFNNIPNLKYLNISKNLIRDIPAHLLGHTNLIDIDLSNNLMFQIPQQLLNIKTLQNVHLQNNKISNLTFSSNNFLLKYLDIRNNRLVFINLALLQKMPNLERLELFGNPWNCKCLDELLEKLAEKGVIYTTDDYYKGELPVCVNLTIVTCELHENNLTHYFNVYTESLN